MADSTHPFRAGPLTGAQRPCERWAVEAADAPAFDPQATFARSSSCTASEPQLSALVAYSITSSAIASKVGGRLRPSALAVFRLMTNSNPTRGHIATSPHGGLYAMPSLCGSA